jgi:hypothetical protein
MSLEYLSCTVMWTQPSQTLFSRIAFVMAVSTKKKITICLLSICFVYYKSKAKSVYYETMCLHTFLRPKIFFLFHVKLP